MRHLSIAMLLCATTLFVGVPPAPAGQAKETSSNPPAASTDKGQAAQPACPGMATGTCCGACMQGQAAQAPCPDMAGGTCCEACKQGQGAAGAQAPKAGQAPADCPCGKMKKGDAPAS